MSNQELIPIENVNPASLFNGEGLDDLLQKIREHATSVERSADTDAGRKEIASLAYKVARSKTTIDNAGKQLVGEWKEKCKAIDAQRKHARDYLDSLKDEIRKPLNDWEAEQERIAEEARQAELKRQAEAEAARIAELERREAEIAAKEAAIKKAEDEARAKAEAEQAEKARLEREEQIRKEAAERAQKEAEAARAAAKLAAERAEREKEEAVRQAEQRARAEAERKVREQAAAERIEKEKAERAAANQKHRKAVVAAAIKALEEEGISVQIAEKAINLIVSGMIPRVSVNF